MGGMMSLFRRKNLIFGRARVKEGPVPDPGAELGVEALPGWQRAATRRVRPALWVLPVDA